uniref:Uncharacterized protein n=1 Tax=Tanacetum cinerariifolium TaxID=118510 RepID=A0A699HU57_TANCI|nr:hypothetical protein [Tanacetum cinerariifolium]
MESLNSNSKERAALVATIARQSKGKLHGIFLTSAFTPYENNNLKGTSIKGGFEQEFTTLFEQDVQTFRRTMFVKFDELEKHLSKEEFQEPESSSALSTLATILDHMESLRESILERPKHKRKKDRSVNDRMMQSKDRKDNSSKALDAGLVVTESNETESERQVLSSRSGNDTHTDYADINSMNDK